MRAAVILAIASLLALWSSACVFVGGYDSGTGWWFWPGGLGLFLIIALIFLLARRRA